MAVGTAGRKDIAIVSKGPANSTRSFADRTERELVHAAKAGSESAFEELVRRNQHRIFRIGWRITANRQDAEDVSQDTFAKAYERLRDFREDSRFSTWLVRIAMNEALQRIRRGRRTRISFDLSADIGEFDASSRIPAHEGGPHESYEHRKLRQLLAECLRRLKPAHRVALVLCDLEELPLHEAARRAGSSTSAVKSRVLRGRLRMRRYLSRYVKS